jgi:hypothetical protein
MISKVAKTPSTASTTKTLFSHGRFVCSVPSSIVPLRRCKSSRPISPCLSRRPQMLFLLFVQGERLQLLRRSNLKRRRTLERSRRPLLYPPKRRLQDLGDFSTTLIAPAVPCEIPFESRFWPRSGPVIELDNVAASLPNDAFTRRLSLLTAPPVSDSSPAANEWSFENFAAHRARSAPLRPLFAATC